MRLSNVYNANSAAAGQSLERKSREQRVQSREPEYEGHDALRRGFFLALDSGLSTLDYPPLDFLPSARCNNSIWLRSSQGPVANGTEESINA